EEKIWKIFNTESPTQTESKNEIEDNRFVLQSSKSLSGKAEQCVQGVVVSFIKGVGKSVEKLKLKLIQFNSIKQNQSAR
ncbi:hypothetical protein DERP_000893, partial [Dermatophagoides pteronyssinus]